MKTISLIFLLVFSTTAAAQQKLPDTNVSDLVIIKSKLGRIVRVDVTRSDPPPRLDESSSFRVDPPEYEWQAKAELEVQNTGSKSIKNIDWELILLVDGNAGQDLRSYRIRSKKLIRPGETVKVTGWFKDNALREMRQQAKAGQLQTKAEIKLIRDEDGRARVSLKVKAKQSE